MGIASTERICSLQVLEQIPMSLPQVDTDITVLTLT